MKKRILFMLLMLFTAFGFVACNGGVTTTGTIDTNLPFVQADTPVNLVITGKVLSWSAVTGATGYAVYIDDVQTTTVTTNSYDFSANTATRIIFSVVALGAQGVANSQRSATLAYIADPVAETASLQTAMDATDMMAGVPDGFAEELVSKGVLVADFNADYAAIETFMEAVEAANGNAVQVNAALTALLLVLDDYEAYVSAVIAVLPDLLDGQMAGIDDQIVYWEDEMEDPYSWYSEEECQSNIDQLNAEKAQLLDLETFLGENSDLITVAVTNVFDYLVDLQSQVTATLLTNVQALAESDDRPTTAEILAIKNEAVNLLLDNMPSQEDVTLVFELLYIMEAELTDATPISYPSQDAYAVRLSMELGLRFLLSLDTTFVDEVFNLIDTGRSQVEISVEMGIHIMQAVNTFELANQTLITAIEAVYTDAQKAAVFEAALDSMSVVYEAQGMSEEELAIVEEVLDGVTYALVDAASAVLESQVDKLFDYLILSDGELLRRIAIVTSIYEDYTYNYETYEYEYFYVNDYTDEVFDSYTDYRVAKQIAIFRAADEGVNAVDATLSTLSEANVASILALVEVMIPTSLMVREATVGVEAFTEVQAAALIAAGKALILDQDANLLGLLGGLTDYAKDEDVFGDLQVLYNALHAYQLAETGNPDYMDSWDWDQTYNDRATVIFACANVTAFVTTARRAQIDAIVNAAFEFLRTAEFLEINGLTLTEVNDMETMVEELITNFLADAAVIAPYNYAALTSGQITIIDEFMNGGFMPAQ